MSNEDETGKPVEADAIEDLELKDEAAGTVAGGVMKSNSDVQSGLASNLKAS
jgi:hypothetical protein